MAYDFEYSGVPSHLQDGLTRWFRHGVEPGSFLSAVLRNDLIGAALRADSISRESLGAIAVWLASNAPEGSYGSPEAFREWPSYLRALERQAEQARAEHEGLPNV